MTSYRDDLMCILILNMRAGCRPVVIPKDMARPHEVEKEMGD